MLKERNGSQTEVGHISCWRYILAANYGTPAAHHLGVFISSECFDKYFAHQKSGSFRPSAAQAMRTTYEARGKGSSASLTGLTVSPFCDGVSQLQSPSAADLLWASPSPFQSLTPSTGRLPRPYSSAECTPQQNGSLLYPVQQLFPPSRSPLPLLSWADPDLLWDHLKKQDSRRLAPETDLKRRHPGITATMRSILLDWMLEASCCPSPSPPSLSHPLLLLYPTGVRGLQAAQRDLLPRRGPLRPLPGRTAQHIQGGSSKDWHHLSICSSKD